MSRLDVGSSGRRRTSGRYAPTPDARRNRARLLRVARDAFAAGGLSVSLDEIARRAGVGPGTLYRHFPTKESLFETVVDGHPA